MNNLSNAFLAAAVALVASCASEPGDPMRVLKTSSTVPAPDAAMAKRAGADLGTLGAGYWIFQRKCLECHEPRIPEDPSLSAWHPTMVGMSWNAGLTDDEEEALIDYMRAAAL